MQEGLKGGSNKSRNTTHVTHYTKMD